VNLERAARVGDELGGHIVSGHVDGVGEVLSVESEGGSHRCRSACPAAAPLHRAQGLDHRRGRVADRQRGGGRRLRREPDPAHLGRDHAGTLSAGARVNLEIDMLARYLARWRETA
jgi:riboflavin synthase